MSTLTCRDRALATALTFLILTVAACGGGLEVVEERPLSAGRASAGFVVFPVAVMTKGATALDCVARSEDVARWLLAHSELPIVGPLDYRSHKEPEEMQVASVDTDLMSRTQGERLDLSSWLVLHILVTENRATNIRDIEDRRHKDPKKLKIYRQYSVEAEVTVEVSVLDARYGRLLARAVVRGQDNPIDVRSDGEPRPLIPKLISLALGRVFAESQLQISPKPRRRLRGREMLSSIPVLAAWGTAKRPSFLVSLKNKDEIEREAALETLWLRFQPGLPVRATFVGKKHPGVMALQPKPPLERYDVVMEVAGQAVRTVSQLDRALQGCGERCPVKVRRGFKDLDFSLRWPPAPRLEDE